VGKHKFAWLRVKDRPESFCPNDKETTSLFLVHSDLQAQTSIAPSKNLLIPSYATHPSPVRLWCNSQN